MIVGLIMGQRRPRPWCPLPNNGFELHVVHGRLLFAVLGLAAMLACLECRSRSSAAWRIQRLLLLSCPWSWFWCQGSGWSQRSAKLDFARWPFRLQPSEFAKLALIIWVANLLAKRRDRVTGWKSLLVPLAR